MNQPSGWTQAGPFNTMGISYNPSSCQGAGHGCHFPPCCPHGLPTSPPYSADAKEVWGVGQRQVRNVYANVETMAVKLLRYSLVETWAQLRSEEELVMRPARDAEKRQPSHADKRRSLQWEIFRQEIRAAV